MQLEYIDAIQKIWEVRKRIDDIHPFLARVFPIAVVDAGQFFIFDADSSTEHYVFVKQAEAPMSFPSRLRAAFPLADYGGQMACVVTKDVFDSFSGYVTIFHEFIHCQQGETCELKIKDTLQVARKAQIANDYSWELNHPFPYKMPEFVLCYDSFLNFLKEKNQDGVLDTRKQLKQLLGAEDFEYMVWQEWKEGFARFIENKIKHKLLLDENHGGTEYPFTRVLFYEGGSRYIEFLCHAESHLMMDIERLFEEMFSYQEKTRIKN